VENMAVNLEENPKKWIFLEERVYIFQFLIPLMKIILKILLKCGLKPIHTPSELYVIEIII
jgi:hypothetical protein